MNRRCCLIRKYVSTLSRKETFVYFNDLDMPYDTFGMYGFSSSSDEVYRLPYTKLELINALGTKVFYNKSEFNYNKKGELISIKCGDSFLAIKGTDKGSSISQREINRLMMKNF